MELGERLRDLLRRRDGALVVRRFRQHDDIGVGTALREGVDLPRDAFADLRRIMRIRRLNDSEFHGKTIMVDIGLLVNARIMASPPPNRAPPRRSRCRRRRGRGFQDPGKDV